MNKKLISKIVEELKSFQYSDAGKNAPPEVKSAIERFRKLPLSERSKVPLLFWLLGNSTPPYKAKPKDVKYVAVSKVKGQTCDNCHFAWIHAINKKILICSIVNENVLPNRTLHFKGWCDRWEGSTR